MRRTLLIAGIITVALPVITLVAIRAGERMSAGLASGGTGTSSVSQLKCGTDNLYIEQAGRIHRACSTSQEEAVKALQVFIAELEKACKQKGCVLHKAPRYVIYAWEDGWWSCGMKVGTHVSCLRPGQGPRPVPDMQQGEECGKMEKGYYCPKSDGNRKCAPGMECLENKGFTGPDCICRKSVGPAKPTFGAADNPNTGEGTAQGTAQGLPVGAEPTFGATDNPNTDEGTAQGLPVGDEGVTGD